MNFEIIDNCFQVCVLLACALFTGRLAWKKTVESARLKASEDFEAADTYEKSVRVCMTVSFGCMSFMLGTLFYVLHLAVLLDITKVFYVSEVSWMAAYLFFISVQLMREEGRKAESRTPLVIIPVLVCIVFYFLLCMDYRFIPTSRVVFLIVLIALLMAVNILALRGIHRNRAAGRSVMPDVLFAALSVLQISLYISSDYILDYTHFNLYFALDITLTLTMVGICTALARECRQEERRS